MFGTGSNQGSGRRLFRCETLRFDVKGINWHKHFLVLLSPFQCVKTFKGP